MPFCGRAMICHFNPRPCTRSDCLISGGRSSPPISTHAPARGATGRQFRHIGKVIFQPTPLHEERPAGMSSVRHPAYFNPRPCTRSDSGVFQEDEIIAISTHAPARGATWAQSPLGAQSTISTHAPARGATRERTRIALGSLFQPTPLHEERRLVSGASRQSRNFNPRPCTRSDRSFR